MTEASYTAWDGNLYEWPPPDGWYQAADGKWWPQGYGPSADGGEGADGEDGISDLLVEPVEEVTSRSFEEEDLPNIDDVFGGENIFADEDGDGGDRSPGGQATVDLSTGLGRDPEPAPAVDPAPDHTPGPVAAQAELAVEAPGPAPLADPDPNPGPDPVGGRSQRAPSVFDTPFPSDGTARPDPQPAANGPTGTGGFDGYGGGPPVGSAPGLTADRPGPGPEGEFEIDLAGNGEVGGQHHDLDHDLDLDHGAGDVGVADGFGNDVEHGRDLHTGHDNHHDGVDDHHDGVDHHDHHDDHLDLEDALHDRVENRFDNGRGHHGPDGGFDGSPVPVVDDADDVDGGFDGGFDGGSDGYDLDRGEPGPGWDQGGRRRSEETVVLSAAGQDPAAGVTHRGPVGYDDQAAPPVDGYEPVGALGTESYEADHYDGFDPQAPLVDDDDDRDYRPDSSEVELDNPRTVWPLAVGGVCVALLVALLLGYLLVRGGSEPATVTAPDTEATGLGSINEPYDFGTGVVVFYEDLGGERRWVVQVLSPVTDGTGQLAQGIDGQVPDGELLAVSRVRITYQSGPAPGRLSDLDFNAIGFSLAVYQQEIDGCAAVSDPLVIDAELEPATSIEGNLCWQITATDLDTLILGVEAGPADGRVHLALG